jgi:voltage-gated potassium channel Kch
MKRSSSWEDRFFFILYGYFLRERYTLTMKKERILIFGSGHLARRVQKLAQADGHDVLTLPAADAAKVENNGLPFENLLERLKELSIETVSHAFLLDDEDEHNMQVMLALMSQNATVPITVSLFNEHIAPHIRAAHSHITVVNPARMAAPFFVEALTQPLNWSLHYNLQAVPKPKVTESHDYLIEWLALGFLSIITAVTTYFKFVENLSWIDSIYFVVVTVATVGYGDINLLASPWQSKLVGIFLILCSTFFIWIIFSLTIDRILKKRERLSLGRRHYTHKNHVIVCGLGRLGYLVAEELFKRGEKVTVVESNENTSSIEALRRKGIPTYVGNARLLNTLEDVNVTEAKALISVISNDYLNLEIGLNARSLHPDLRIVLRIFDDQVAHNIKDVLDIQLAISMSAMIDDLVYATK